MTVGVCVHLCMTVCVCVRRVVRQGKVRDTYDLGDRVVIVTTDRQSAFDRLLASVPFKGQVRGTHTRIHIHTHAHGHGWARTDACSRRVSAAGEPRAALERRGGARPVPPCSPRSFQPTRPRPAF
jgi:hypothetical protein